MPDEKTERPQGNVKKPVPRPADRARREQDWADRDPGESRETPARQTYRDGSAISECWNPGKY
ncbi:MAG: hypothetical protein CW338_00940 [Clostridiales bacterium]|nr:hypothetical protein [Clostridiales bacterium]